MRIAVDTNVLVYAEGVGDAARRDRAVSVLEALAPHTIMLPIQVLGELFNVLCRTSRFAPQEVLEKVIAWRDGCGLIDTNSAVMTAAARLAAAHRLGIWDSVIIAAAAESDCQLLLSEDLQDGFLWRGVTVANPFAETMHPMLASALAP